MKIVITGAGGMVGRSVVKALETRKIHELFMPFRAELDLLDKPAVDAYMAKIHPDCVIHCAAKVGGIQSNIDEQVEYIIENTYISTNVINAALKAGVKNLLNMATACMYPKDKPLLPESILLDGKLEPTNEGYALAKITSAILCKSIHKQYKLNYKTLIPCNLYGPHDNFDLITSHMLPGVINKIHHAKLNNLSEVSMWGDGTARREFMFVDDLANFIVLALEDMNKLPEMVNVGLGYDYSINEYYQAIADVVGFTGTFKHELDKPVGMKCKLLDISKAKNMGWKAKTGLQEGIQKSYEYFLTLSQ